MITINHTRIKLARQLQRLSMDELVSRMGSQAVSKMSISKMERGLLRPSQTTLQAIADACQLPIAFFCQPQTDMPNLEFRFSQTLTQRQRRELTAMAHDVVHRYLQVQSADPNPIAFRNPLPHTVLRTYGDVEEAVIKIRRKWDIGLQPIHSVYELLACYGIHVLEADFGCDNVIGLSTFVKPSVPSTSSSTAASKASTSTATSKASTSKGPSVSSPRSPIPIIIINARANATTERKRFTALHELAHLLFRLQPANEEQHQAYLDTLPTIPYRVTLKVPDTERLCNLFASAMLMPAPCALRRFGPMRTAIAVEEFFATRQLYGNSVAAQIHRLHDLRIIDDTLYSNLYDTIIHPDPMEQTLGNPFPIMETADRQPLLEHMLQVEMKKMEMVSS